MAASDARMKKLNGAALAEVEGKLNVLTKSNERRKFGEDVIKL